MRWNSAARLVPGILATLASAAAPASPPSLGPAELGDLSIEELLDVRIARVQGASRFEQKVTRAPAAVSVITAEEIRRAGYRTLAEILASLRGVYLSNDRNYTYLGVRGFLRPGDYNSRVLLLLDGHRMNDNIYDGAYVGREAMVPVEAIERVEFIRGPSSSIYGSSAFFGVIDVVTRRGADFAGSQGWLEGASRHTHEEGFTAGRVSDAGTDLALAGVNYHSQGRRSLHYPEFGGTAHDADAEQARSLWARVAHGAFSVATFASSRDKEIPTASFGTVFDDGREQTRDRRFMVEARADYALGEVSRLVGTLAYDRYEYAGDYPIEGDDGSIVVNHDESLGRWIAAGLQLSTRAWSKHTLLAGVEYRLNLDQVQLNYDAPLAGEYLLEDRRSSDVLGVYAQGEFALGSGLAINAGLRYDQYFESFGHTLNPRIGLIADPWQGTTLKLLYGQAYRAPNAYEQFYFAGPAQAAPLQPETIRTYEAVAEHYLARSWRLGASVYRYTVQDLITQTATADGDILFENRDRVNADGLELEASGDCGGLRFDASYALQRTEDFSSGRELSNSPRQLARARVMGSLRWGIEATGELRFQDSVQTVRQEVVPGFWLFNLHFSGRTGLPGLEWSASAINLLDRRYAHPGAEDHAQDRIEQDGRTLRFRLAYRH